MLVAVWSDHQGNPIPRAQSFKLHAGGIGHWLLGYGTIGQRVQVMQQWGGKLQTYDLSGGPDQEYGIEILRTVPSATAARKPHLPLDRPGDNPRTYIVRAGETLRPSPTKKASRWLR